MKLARFGVLLCAFGAACAEAGGEAKGGSLTDAGEQAVTLGDFDGGAGPAGPGPKCDGEPTWTGLYQDVFGPTGKPGSCSFQADCHGTPGTIAAEKGIQCFDQKICRESMIAKGLWTPGNAEKPENANGIQGTIRSINPKTGKKRGFMPKVPADFVFPDACIQRLEAWIAKGVPAD